MSWSVERLRARPAEIHSLEPTSGSGRSVWRCDATAAALVLGSTQPDEVADLAACAAAGVEVVRRRSGGGAVLVEPDAVLWVDVVLPAGDPLWQPDVGRAFIWLGRAWAGALEDLGLAAVVHEGPLVRRPLSDLVCFAGLGPGEVLVEGRKVVGISQRRTRDHARFQCAALLRWEPARLLALVARGGTTGSAQPAELAALASAVPVGGNRLFEALLANLP